MKRKLLATLTALITVFFCAAGLTACGGEKEPELSPISKAYQNYLTTQNMTVTVTDTRAEKHGYDYTALVKIDHAHKSANVKKNGFEDYYEITETNGKFGFTIYSAAYIEENGITNTYYSKIVRDDLFENGQDLYDNPNDYAVHLMNDWVSNSLPTHVLPADSFSINENDDLHYASLELLWNLFTESENGYSASIYFCASDNDGGFTAYPCTATIKLDGQGRFENVVLNLGANGKISAEFTYGTANVIIPDNVKNSQ